MTTVSCESGFAWSRHLRDLLPLELVKDSLGRKHHHGLNKIPTPEIVEAIKVFMHVSPSSYAF